MDGHKIVNSTIGFAVYIKCQTLFSGKNKKKKIIKLDVSAKLAKRVVKAKACSKCHQLTTMVPTDS